MPEEKQKEFKKILDNKKSINGLYKQYLIHLTPLQIKYSKVLCQYNEKLKLGYTFKLNYAKPKNKKYF